MLHWFNMVIIKTFQPGGQTNCRSLCLYPLFQIQPPILIARSLASHLLLPPLPPSSHLQSYTQIFLCRLPSPKLLLYHSPKIQQNLPNNPQVTPISKATTGLHFSPRSSKFSVPVSSLYCLYHLLFRRPPALASPHPFPIP